MSNAVLPQCCNNGYTLPMWKCFGFHSGSRTSDGKLYKISSSGVKVSSYLKISGQLASQYICQSFVARLLVIASA